MTYLSRHSEDARWLGTQLRSHLICALAIVGFLVLVQFQSHPANEVAAQVSAPQLLAPVSGAPVSGAPVSGAPVSGAPVSDVLESRADSGDHLPAETELVYLPVRRPNPVPPQGWRRTRDGWEHVSTWRPLGRPLGEIVMEQEAREPGWMKGRVGEAQAIAAAGLRDATDRGHRRHRRRVAE